MAERQGMSQSRTGNDEEINQLNWFQRMLYNAGRAKSPGCMRIKMTKLDSARRTLRILRETEELYKSAVTNKDKAWYEGFGGNVKDCF